MNNRLLKKVTALLIILSIFHNSLLFAKVEEDGNILAKSLNRIKKTIIFIAEPNKEGKIIPCATGFLIGVEGIFHLVTAKHVLKEDILEPQKNGTYKKKERWRTLFACFNKKDKRIGLRSLNEIKETYGVNWIFHKNEEVDIAIIPFGIDKDKDDVLIMPYDLFLSVENLVELYDVFFLSYQPGVKSKKKISPIIRTGTISLINDDNTFYIDGFAFPGNSGSPVFLKYSAFRFDEKGYTIGDDQLGGKLIGIIGEYIPYREIAISTQTKRPRVIFEENTGLSKIWSTTFILEILESEQFKSQLKKLLNK